MSQESVHIRSLLNQQLGLLIDPRFEHRLPLQQHAESSAGAIELIGKLRARKAAFFKSYNYEWAQDENAYNTPFETLLQWRLLNVLSDLDTDHPALEQCTNLVVRVLPNSCARPHLRKIEQYRVIILTSGYLSAFKGFARLWLRGSALGGAEPGALVNQQRNASNYLVALRNAEATMGESALAYAGTLIQLLSNELPYMDRESIFDSTILKREDWGIDFGLLSTAIDGFVLFHETAHVLAGDGFETERTTEAEVKADRGSVSLCIIDEARKGGFGTVYLGGPMFFCVELLRLLSEEILELIAGRHSPENGRYNGIEELMMRSRFYPVHLAGYLGPVFVARYEEWSNTLGLVFDTVRWALLHVHSKSAVSLSEFVMAQAEARSIL